MIIIHLGEPTDKYLILYNNENIISPLVYPLIIKFNVNLYDFSKDLIIYKQKYTKATFFEYTSILQYPLIVCSCLVVQQLSWIIVCLITVNQMNFINEELKFWKTKKKY